jgi:hypothetical protein
MTFYKKPEAAGEISADGMYTLAEIRARLGLGTYALREARRRGRRGHLCYCYHVLS